MARKRLETVAVIWNDGLRRNTVKITAVNRRFLVIYDVVSDHRNDRPGHTSFSLSQFR